MAIEMNDEARELLKTLAAQLRKDTAPIEMFAFGELPFSKVTHTVSVAHGTSQHVAMVLEQLVGS